MSVDPSVISAMTAAADADPENMALRSHLAALQFESGQFSRALENCRIVLGRRPDDAQVLELASNAAEKAGDSNAAAGYRKLHEALGWKQTRGLFSELGPDPFKDDLPDDI